MKFFKRRGVLIFLGLVLLSLFIWFGGPYLAFADYKPLESVFWRLVAIGILVGLWLLSVLAKIWRAARASAKLAQAMVAQKGPPVARRREPRGAAATRTLRGGHGHLEEESAARQEPVRIAVVRDHRTPGLRQDHGAGQFGLEVSARAALRQGSRARRRRHAQLRLVVHRRGRAARHGGALHNAGFRRVCRQCGLGGIPQLAHHVSQAAALEWRDRHALRRRPDDAYPAGARGQRRGGAAAAR